MWAQEKINLQARSRGFHLVTDELIQKISVLKNFEVGLLHLFIQHTSAALAINENADSDVRVDMEAYFNKSIPENEPYFKHTLEGSDDMPAHIKAVVLGESLSIPISKGRLMLGVWQGIYLCEHRNVAGRRTVIATLNGE